MYTLEEERGGKKENQKSQPQMGVEGGGKSK